MNIRKYPGEDNFFPTGPTHHCSCFYCTACMYFYWLSSKPQTNSQQKKNHVLQPQQSGFRLCNSTVTTTTAVVNDIVNLPDKKQLCAALFVVQCKAFDTVHDMLFSERLCVFFYVSFHICSELYFSNRVQTVADEGAPQGSILCPLLFTVHIL